MEKGISNIDLMRYLDGDLADDESRDVAQALRSDDDAQRYLRSYRQLGECVRTYGELEADDAEAGLARVWERIEGRLGDQGAAEEAAIPAALPAPKPRDEGAWARIGAWLDSMRGYFVTGTVAAAAAAALVLALGGEEPRPAAPGIASSPPPTTSVRTQPAALVSEPPEVESLEIYGASGSVLTIPSEDDGGGTAVIWLDRESQTEGPI